MPYYAIFATPLDRPFALDGSGSEYSAELDAESDDAAYLEAERHFQPNLLAIHYYPTRDKTVAEGRTLIDYEDVERARIRDEEADL